MPRPSFHKLFETTFANPLVSDQDLLEYLAWCRAQADFISAIAVNTHQLPIAVQALNGSGIRPAAEIAFPLGCMPLELKLIQIQEALELGAEQIDIVLETGMLRENRLEELIAEGEQLLSIIPSPGVKVVWIANLPLLDGDQVDLAARAGARLGGFLRTAPGCEAVLRHGEITCLRQSGGSGLHITACGSIATIEQVLDALSEGANMIHAANLAGLLASLDLLLKLQETA